MSCFFYAWIVLSKVLFPAIFNFDSLKQDSLITIIRIKWGAHNAVYNTVGGKLFGS
jgi:hypothetical protein